MEVVKKIRKLRELKGYSQEYIASKMNISQRSYSRIEKGEINLHLSKLSQICEILEVSITKALDFDESVLFKNSSPTEDESKLANKERELYEKQIDHLKEEVLFLRNQLKKTDALTFNRPQ